MTGKKTAKGAVSLSEFRNCLLLRWRHQGKRYALYLGLPDTRVNRTVAQRKASQIELDIAAGHFDKTLKSYKPASPQSMAQSSVIFLWRRFSAEKTKDLHPRTVANYRGLESHLNEYFQGAPVSSVDIEEVRKFALWLATYYKNDRVLRERIAILSSCWEWGIAQKLTQINPWADFHKIMKIAPQQTARPFTIEEIQRIIEAFKTDTTYAYLSDYVIFLFATGARTGEVIGLKWKHLSEDCSTVWIGESLSRGERKATKTNKARTITLPDRLQEHLQSKKKSLNLCPEDLVFPSKHGGAIDDNNFRSRAWKPILERLGIPYRKPYITRHSLVSHALDSGMSPLQVAQMTGHRVKTMFQHYAGHVSSKPKLPDILG